MNLFKIAPAIVAVASMMIAAPAFAQEAMQEPGTFEYYHPDADVRNGGASVRTETLGAMASVPFGNGTVYDSYAYAGPVRAVRHGRAAARDIAASAEGAFPVYDAPPEYDLYGRACIPAPRVGAFATQPWDTQTPCEPSY